MSLQVMLDVARLDVLERIPRKPLSLTSERHARSRCTVFRFCNAPKP